MGFYSEIMATFLGALEGLGLSIHKKGRVKASADIVSKYIVQGKLYGKQYCSAA